MKKVRQITDYILGSSAAATKIREQILKAAPSQVPVLIQGEMGVGKELVARALHHFSRRNGQPFVTVNCAALPQNHAENELFDSEAELQGMGHRPGLVESARGGTLFLDQVCCLPPRFQALILRFADTGEIRRIGGGAKPRHVDARLICSTRHDLYSLCQHDDFRADLLFRIDVVRLTIPPLRERREDIPTIAEAAMIRICKRHGISSPGLSAVAVQALREHDWPGNVRELENAVERAVVMTEKGQLIGPEQLGLEVRQEDSNDSGQPAAPNAQPQDQVIQTDPVGESLSLEEYFQQFILTHQDYMSETDLARKLGISRKCLWERRQRFGIPRPASRRDATSR